MAKRKRVALHFNMGRVHQQGIVRGVIEYARLRGNWELFGAFWTLAEAKNLAKWKGDGVVAAVEGKAEARALARSGLPVVDIAEAVPDAGFSIVANDNLMTGRLGGEHMVRAGLTDFAYCGVADAVWSDKRREGFRQAVGRRSGRLAVFTRPAAWWQAAGTSRALVAFLRKLPRPVGVMAANDTVGVKVTTACHDTKLHVPDDVAVVGVDNEDILCQLSPTPLSSIPFNRPEIGLRAAERLDVLMRHLVRYMPPLSIPPLPVVARASSEVVIASDPLVRKALTLIRDRAGKLSVGEIAPVLHASRRNLERRFRENAGRGILEEIHRVRVGHAGRLLRETDLPLAKIAAAAGFNSPARFNDVFSRYIGSTPKEYRFDRGVMKTQL